MTFTFIPMPALEELVMGYVPSTAKLDDEAPHHPEPIVPLPLRLIAAFYAVVFLASLVPFTGDIIAQDPAPSQSEQAEPQVARNSPSPHPPEQRSA